MRLDLDIDDFWSNHSDLPSYGGPTAGTISLLDVKSVEVSISHTKEFTSTIWIYGFEVTEHPQGGYQAEIAVSPGRIAVHFMDSICPKLELAS
jgi:hypothetical protein